MTKFTTVYNNFSGGKVSEKFKGRFDTPAYHNSLEDVENMYPGPMGGLFGRTGSVKVANLDSILNATFQPWYRQIPFDTGDGNSYILFITSHTLTLQNFNTYIRIYHNDRTETATFYSSANITARQVGSNWVPNTTTLSGIANWKYAQVGDLLFLTHASGEQRPLVISRTSTTTFDINYADQYQTSSENMHSSLKYPITSPNISSITLALTGTTLTASAALFSPTMNTSQSHFRVDDGTTSKVLRVTGYTNTTTVTVAYVIGTGNFTATDNWQQSSWTNKTTGVYPGFGWPTSVASVNQKLVWGGNEKFPDFIWASLTGNLFHMNSHRLDQDASADVSGVNFFGDAVLGPDPFDLRASAIEANAIQWLASGRVLTIGTTGGEYLINGIGTDSLNIEANSNYGSSPYQAIRMGKDLVFVGPNGRNLRTYRYSRENGSWVSDDLTIKIDSFNDDKFTTTGPMGKAIIDFAWNSQHKLLFVATTSGAYVYGHDPEFGINGWADFNIGAESGETATIQSFVSIKNNVSNEEEIFMFVVRTEGINTVSYLEKLTVSYLESTLKHSFSTYSDASYYNNMDRLPRFLDWASEEQANGSGECTHLDFTPIIGRFVTATWFDGTVFSFARNIEIIAGGLGGILDYTFPDDVFVIFGYEYTTSFKTLPPEAGGQFGTSMGDVKQIHESYLRLYRTKDFSIGSIDKRSNTELDFEDFEYDDLYTSDQRVQVMDNPDTDAQIIIRNTKPTPLNVLALISKGISND